MDKIFKIIFNCLLIFVIIVLTGYLILRLTNKIKIYNVETGSMEDKIHTGDYILLFKEDKYSVGDVVTYRVRDYFITHRITSIDGDKVITKGDANNTEDAQINLNQIEGKAVYWGGILNIVVNFKFVIIALLIVLYLLSCYFGDEKEKDKIQKEKELDINKKNDNITEIKLEDVIKKEENTSIDEGKEENTSIVESKEENTSIDEGKEEKTNEIEEIMPKTEIINVLEENNEIKKTKKESIKKSSTETKKKTTRSSGKNKTETKGRKTSNTKSINTKTKKTISEKSIDTKNTNTNK